VNACYKKARDGEEEKQLEETLKTPMDSSADSKGEQGHSQLRKGRPIERAFINSASQ